MGDPALGFVVRPEAAPEQLAASAREVEAAGFDELWLWEACFLAGAIAASTTALAATSRIKVGVGIMPAPVRNPAFLAGLGDGATDWMRQIGAKPESQLTLLEETVAAIRELLAGEEVHADGRYGKRDGVRLDQPPDEVPPVLTGVRRPRSLALSGRVAAVVGTPERCAAAIRPLGEAGTDSVVLVPPAPDGDVGALADQLLPLLRG